MSSPMTSTPYAANYVASAPPKRPRPITATAPCCAMGVGLPMKNAAGRVRHFLLFISDVLSVTFDLCGDDRSLNRYESDRPETYSVGQGPVTTLRLRHIQLHAS